MLKFATVDVKDIKSEQLRSNFAEEDIEKLAEAILANNGLLRPLILKEINLENSLVLDGHLEYYAAVRAREKDPRKAEMVNAFVIKAKDEEAIKKQIEILRGKTNTQSQVQSTNSDGNWISSFETRLQQSLQEQFQKNLDFESRLKQLEQKLSTKKKDLLSFINNAKKQELIEELSLHQIQSNKIEALYQARQQKESKKFVSFQEIANLKIGLADKTIVKLLDSWSRIYGSID
jgi:ParB-like nuclease domain